MHLAVSSTSRWDGRTREVERGEVMPALDSVSRWSSIARRSLRKANSVRGKGSSVAVHLLGLDLFCSIDSDAFAAKLVIRTKHYKKMSLLLQFRYITSILASTPRKWRAFLQRG